MVATDLNQRDIAKALVSHLTTDDVVDELARRGGLTGAVVLRLLEVAPHTYPGAVAGGMSGRLAPGDGERKAARTAALEMFANMIDRMWSL